MAEIVFTEIALLHVRAVSTSLAWMQPVVSLAWSKGTVDNWRGPGGEAQWRTIEPPKWLAFVSDWHGDVADHDPDLLPRIEGIAVYCDKKAGEATGRFLISLTERGLAVEYSAT